MAEKTADDRATEMGFQDPSGKAWLVYSTTGQPVSLTAMQIAHEQASSGKPVPSGLAVVPASVDEQGQYTPQTSGGAVRSWMNNIQAKADALGKPMDSPTPWGGNIPQMMWQRLTQVPGEVLKTATTPENLGMLGGIVATSLIPTPGGAVVGPAARGALALLGAGGGRLAGGALAGAPPDLPTAATQAAMAAATGGALEFGNYFMNQYLTVPWVRNKLATDLVTIAQKDQPGLATNPQLFNAYGASGAKQWQGIAQKMGQALADDAQVSTHELTASLLNDVQQNAQAAYGGKVPADLISPGAQKALMRNSEAAMGAYRDYLNRVANGDKVEPLIQVFEPYSKKAGELIAASTQGLLDETGAQSVVQKTFTDFAAGQAHTVDGARILDLARRSGQKSGFDPVAFWNLVKQEYLQDPSSTIGQMGQLLENHPLAQPGLLTGAQQAREVATQALPNVMQTALKTMQSAPPTPPPPMLLPGKAPWLRPTQAGISATTAVDTNALKRFSGEPSER